MTLDERITEIANIGITPKDKEVIKDACYAAISAFAEQEPSEAMLKEGALAILRVSTLLGGPVENFRIGARAMMQAAIKELK